MRRQCGRCDAPGQSIELSLLARPPPPPVPLSSTLTLQLDDIKSFRQWDSTTPGHPENFLTPGVEVTTGEGCGKVHQCVL